ncbi:hypothetical protein ACFQX8_15480 [Klenkia terrae]|uniref:hypothetical protein n=1 Tax=Klenkia terrae TaxID=1052259 RepID=UPI003622A949
MLPGRIEVVELAPDPPAPAVGALPTGVVVLGPGGDDGAPVLLDLVRSGGLLVAGPRAAGAAARCARWPPGWSPPARRWRW